MYLSLPNHQASHQRYLSAEADHSKEISIAVYLHPHKDHKDDLQDMVEFLQMHPAKRSYAKDRFEKHHDAIDALQAFADAHHLRINKGTIDSRRVELSGTIGELSLAFHVHFAMYKNLDGIEHLGYEGQLSVPEELAEHIVHIGNLDDGLIKGKRTRLNTEAEADSDMLTATAPSNNGFGPQDIERIYEFPEGDAKGECIGLVELGGTFEQSDIKAYCEAHGVPVPKIVTVGTPPPVPQSEQMIDQLEVTMDIQLAAGLAPGAKIVIYYARTIEDAIHLALEDTKNKPSVLSISWALSEMNLSGSARAQLDYLTLEAARKGITLVAASGDYGAYNHKNYLNVMSPASNPLVLACGGTALHTNGDNHTETVWGTWEQNGSFSGTGGGYSRLYKDPYYQTDAVKKYRQYFPKGQGGRAVPDIAANSDSATAYNIVINGRSGAWGGGTSASTPVWAALIARLNKQLGYRLGFFNHILYQAWGQEDFNQVLSGNNAFYPAAYGWNAATGLGTPKGEAILKAIKKLEPNT